MLTLLLASTSNMLCGVLALVSYMVLMDRKCLAGLTTSQHPLGLRLLAFVSPVLLICGSAGLFVGLMTLITTGLR